MKINKIFFIDFSDSTNKFKSQGEDEASTSNISTLKNKTQQYKLEKELPKFHTSQHHPSVTSSNFTKNSIVSETQIATKFPTTTSCLRSSAFQ